MDYSALAVNERHFILEILLMYHTRAEFDPVKVLYNVNILS